MPGFLDGCQTALVEGATSEEVMARLRAQYTTAQCLRSKTCHLRTHYNGPLDAAGRALVHEAAAMATTPAQTDALRQWIAGYGRRPWKPTGNAPLDALLRKRTLLPANVDGLRITHEEVARCKELGRYRAVEQHKTATRVDGAAVVAHVCEALSRPSALGLYDLALLLLAASGRRTVEILNGRSTFAPSAKGEHWALFEGQAKVRKPIPAYDIPLVVPFAVFSAALAELRRRQPATIKTCTSEQISRRYQSAIGKHLERDSVLSVASTPHKLRGIYVWLVYRLFDWGDNYVSYVAYKVLGHADIGESHPYVPFLVDEF